MPRPDCIRCSMNMRIDPNCYICHGTGEEPLTDRDVQEIVFRAETILGTPKPDDASVH